MRRRSYGLITLKIFVLMVVATEIRSTEAAFFTAAPLCRTLVAHSSSTTATATAEMAFSKRMNSFVRCYDIQRPHTKYRNLQRYRCLLSNPMLQRYTSTRLRLHQRGDTPDFDNTTSKGIVSISTDIVNFVFDTWSSIFPRATAATTAVFTYTTNDSVVQEKQQPPSSPLELLSRIRNDYTERNYLWTGDLDVDANFVPSCRFTDPTLSFVGTDQYKRNIQNLRPILNTVTNVERECRSDLLDIQLFDEYIQTRWNMIGTLTRLPWQPTINVIGQTKFWFDAATNSSYRIYFYDEVWELPARHALLQLITPTHWDPK